MIRLCSRVLILAACLLVAGATPAENRFSRPGYYIAVSAAYGIADLNVNALSQFQGVYTPPFSSSGSGGLNLRVGRRFESWAAFEIEYEWMDQFSINQAGGGQAARYRPNTLTMNGKFYLPIPRIQPYLLAGIGLINYDFQSAPLQSLLRFGSNYTGFAVRAGGGLDAYITDHIVVFFEGTYLLNTDQPTLPGTGSTNRVKILDQLNYASIAVGLAYRF
ncbi:porin family protein [Myxococcota bacterium]|nr:porin family protein [Myxococcota bacterium]